MGGWSSRRCTGTCWSGSSTSPAGSAPARGRLLLEQRDFDPVSGIAQETQTLIDPDGSRESRTFSTRIYSATELVAMLLAAGFEKATAYGDLSGAPFGTDTRLVLVARKAQDTASNGAA